MQKRQKGQKITVFEEIHKFGKMNIENDLLPIEDSAESGENGAGGPEPIPLPPPEKF